MQRDPIRPRERSRNLRAPCILRQSERGVGQAKDGEQKSKHEAPKLPTSFTRKSPTRGQDIATTPYGVRVVVTRSPPSGTETMRVCIGRSANQRGSSGIMSSTASSPSHRATT